MIFLLAKYTLLFLLASALGFFLGYWWSRRNFVDVSETYEDLRKATQRDDVKNWESLWSRLNTLPAPKETDLSPVERRIDALAKKVDAIPVPADLSPVRTKLVDLETTVRNIPKPAAQKDVDLQPVKSELSSIQRQIRELPKVETHDPVDLAPFARQIESLEQRVSRIPQPEKIDVKPIADRLQSVESELARLGKRLSQPQARVAAPRKREPSAKKSAEPKILSAALYGKKDNLRLISGVGPKLENLLNKNGVYYFWQVASWSNSDIKVVDERLDSFKGRISRDGWVSQAKQLRKSPDAASTPANI